MTTTQLQGLRCFHAATTTQPATMSAREMALTAHRLSKSGMRAACTDGRIFVWSNTDNCWKQA